MKKYLSLLLALLLCFCLISCSNKDKNDNQSGDGASTPSQDVSLSGETVWLPSSITYTNSNGISFEMQTIEMEGTVAKVRHYTYNNYSQKVLLSGGYDLDLSKTNPLELISVRYSSFDNAIKNGFRKFTVSADGTTVTEEYGYDVEDGVDKITNYIITYDEQDRIEKLVIKSKYEDEPEETEERTYQYGDTGYTISYIDMNWSQKDDDDTRFLRHYCYEIPYEGDEITITETYRKQDGSVHFPDDFHTYSDQKVDKLVHKVNRQGFCTGNTLYFKNGQTETNKMFFDNLRFSGEFNDKGMPTRYVTTSNDGSHPHTSTFTYDDNGNLISYHEESEQVNFTCEIEWKEYPAELGQIFSAVFNSSHFAISEVMEDNCPAILVGPQELIYQKNKLFK